MPAVQAAADADVSRCGGIGLAEAAEHAGDEAVEAVCRGDTLLGEGGFDARPLLAWEVADDALEREDDAPAVGGLERGEHDERALGGAGAAGWEDPDLVAGGRGNAATELIEQLGENPGREIGCRAGVGSHGLAGSCVGVDMRGI